MRQHLGVGGGAEFVAGLEQPLLERVVIFNDAVVDDGDFAGLVQVRMGILIGRRAVGGPARVADAEVARDRFGLQTRRAKPSSILPFSCAGAGRPSREHGHARAVVAAIFQPPQAFEQDGRRCFLADVSDNAAHIVLSIATRECGCRIQSGLGLRPRRRSLFGEAVSSPVLNLNLNRNLNLSAYLHPNEGD